jgi:UDP-galactose transporter B1
MAAMFASNDALRFLSYPIQSLGKSCKIIPVMIMGVLVERRTFTRQQYIGAFLITLGVIYVNFSEINRKSRPEERSGTLYGVCLLLFSLICDGLVGACQGIINASDPNKFFKPDALETMYLMNSFASLFILPPAVISGQLFDGVKYLCHSPAMLKLLTAFNVCASLGQFFVFLTITEFSPLICTTVTTSRKFITILLSVFRFGHKLSSLQWLAVFVVFFGLFLELCSKRQIKHINQTDFQKEGNSPNIFAPVEGSCASSPRSMSNLKIRKNIGGIP